MLDTSALRSILNLHTYRQYRSVWGQAWGFVQGGKGEGWVSLKISLAVTVSLAASHLRLNNGVPPQFREGVAPLTGARFPSCINWGFLCRQCRHLPEPN